MSGYVSTEFSSITLRFHPSGYGFGSPYTWTCRVSEHPFEKWTAVISALQGMLLPAARHQFAHTLKGLGFERVCFSIKGRWHTYSVDRWAE